MEPERVCLRFQYFKYIINNKFSRCCLVAIRKLRIRIIYRPDMRFANMADSGYPNASKGKSSIDEWDTYSGGEFQFGRYSKQTFFEWQVINRFWQHFYQLLPLLLLNLQIRLTKFFLRFKKCGAKRHIHLDCSDK